jgi:hypothetical protein
MSLNGNNIGDEGARYIADALKVNSSLHDIDFNDGKCLAASSKSWNMLICLV